MSWIDDLDMCAATGVLSHDAPAEIMGTQPRYVGNPKYNEITNQLPPMKQQPKKDEFKNSNNGFKNPLWKKILFGTTALAATIFLGYKIKNKKLLTNLTDKFKKIPEKVKNLFSEGWEFLKKGWNKLVNVFKKTPTPTA